MSLPAVLYLPASQSVHDAARVPEMVPARHDAHVEEPFFDHMPALQLMQLNEPNSAAKVPAYVENDLCSLWCD